MTEVFVFGSNLAGRHGKGAALTALRRHGAEYGKAIGFQGRSYAIPTKDHRFKVLPLYEIDVHVEGFYRFAWRHKSLDFMVTQIGCGLAAYSPEQIAPLFDNMPSNVYLPADFLLILYGKVSRRRVSFYR